MKRSDYIRDLDDEDLAQWFCDTMSNIGEEGCVVCPASHYCYGRHMGAEDYMQEDI